MTTTRRLRTTAAALAIGATALGLSACGSTQHVPSAQDATAKTRVAQSSASAPSSVAATPTATVDLSSPEAVVYAYIRQEITDPTVVGATSEAATLAALDSYYAPGLSDSISRLTGTQDADSWATYAPYGYTSVDAKALPMTGAVDTIKVPTSTKTGDGAYVNGAQWTEIVPTTDGKITKIARTSDFHLVPAATTGGPAWQIDGVTGHATVIQ